MPNGSCQQLDPECCQDQGGSPGPAGSQCGGVEACCLPDNSCLQIDSACCALQGGDSQGINSACGAPQACILPDESCINVDPACCLGQAGDPEPGDPCTEPRGCCFPNGTCANLDPVVCVSQGGTPLAGICLGDGNGNGSDDLCDEPPIPTVSQWGLIVLALLLAVGAKIRFGRREELRLN